MHRRSTELPNDLRTASQKRWPLSSCARQRIKISHVDCEEEGIPDQAKSVCRERIMTYSGPVAPAWLKPKTVTKLWGIAENLVRYSLWDHFLLGYFSPLSNVFFNFYSRQVEIEQKKSLKLDFEGDEMENPKECGVQWRTPIAGGPDPSIIMGCLPEQLEFKAVPTMATPCWEQYTGPSCL